MRHDGVHEYVSQAESLQKEVQLLQTQKRELQTQLLQIRVRQIPASFWGPE